MHLAKYILNKRIITLCCLAMLVYKPASAINTMYNPGASLICDDTTLNSNAVFIARYCQNCSPESEKSTNCSLTIKDYGTCEYYTECKYGYENIQNSGKYNAICSAIKYNIAYNLNGGKYDGVVTEQYTVESDSITLPIPNRKNYVFDGWFDNAEFNGDAVTQIAAGSTENKTYYAKWTREEFVCKSGVWFNLGIGTRACLDTEKTSSPAFGIYQNGKTYYLNMTTDELPVNMDTTKKFKVYYNGNEYSLHDNSIYTE